MWERFSYYGMRALLVLYLVKYVLLPEHSAQVIGLATLKGGLETIFGPLEPQPFASQIYGTYTALVYLTPVFGGLLADRVLGQRKTVVIGASLMAIGHFMMAFEPLLLFALLTLILANGLFKPNISTQVGGLYKEGDPRRDRAYSIFYVGINVGAFLAPLICGTLGEKWGWHYGFGAAGVGMVIGLLIYLRGLRELPPDELQKAKAAHVEHNPMSQRRLARDLRAVDPVFAEYALLGDLRAAGQHCRAMGRQLHRPLDQPSVLARRDPGDVVPGVQPVHDFRLHAADRGAMGDPVAKGPGTIDRDQDGDGLFHRRALLSRDGGRGSLLGPGGKSSWLWLFLYFAIITIGELYLSPVGLSLVSKVAPARILSMMMGVWLSTSFLGNFLAGWLGSYWSSMEKPNFFLMIAGVAAAAGVSIILLNRPLRKSLQH